MIGICFEWLAIIDNHDNSLKDSTQFADELSSGDTSNFDVSSDDDSYLM